MTKTKCTASEFVKMFYSQLGVKEKPANSNNVKYNTLYYGHNVYGSWYAWCFVVQWWCAVKAIGKKQKLYPKNANAAYGQDEIVSKCGGEWIMKKTTKTAPRRRLLTKLKRGDNVDFDFGAMDAYRRHTGTFYSRNGNYAFCLEGNTSPDNKGSQSNGGMVCLKHRHYTQICSCARPDFLPETPTKKKKTSTKKTNTSTVKKPKVYVNAGHSNTDTGAVSKYAVERKLNVRVRNAMVKCLEDNYICEVRWNDGNLKDIKKITDAANKWGADLYVSIHFNSGGGDGWEGLLYNLDAKHKACGKIFEKHVKAIGQNSRGLKARPDLKNLSLTNMMAILNECAFIDNWKDIKDWNEDAELKKMGQALAKATAEYLGLKRKKKV